MFGALGSGRDTCAVQVWEWDLSAGNLAAMMQAWLLEPLSLLPSDIDAFEFTHWSALKAAHGGSDVTSASPLSMARLEADGYERSDEPHAASF